MKRYSPSLLTVFLTFCMVITFFCARGYNQVNEEGEELQKLNINTATLEELSNLPKISIRNAKSIIRYREKHGPFKRIEDVNKVPGIDRREYRAIKDMITVEEIEPADKLEPTEEVAPTEEELLEPTEEVTPPEEAAPAPPMEFAPSEHELPPEPTEEQRNELVR